MRFFFTDVHLVRGGNPLAAYRDFYPALRTLGGGSYGSLEGDFLVGGALGRGFSLSASAHQQESDRAPLGRIYPNAYPKVAAGGVAAAKREDYVGGISSQSQYLRLDHEAGDKRQGRPDSRDGSRCSSPPPAPDARRAPQFLLARIVPRCYTPAASNALDCMEES